ncbi:MAG: hypothetical protein JXA43_03090 [Candidatus Diapherotrites archaeon]|nr:hypothetical protein [Candidatus Diapherotrites archaeon]
MKKLRRDWGVEQFRAAELEINQLTERIDNLAARDDLNPNTQNERLDSLIWDKYLLQIKVNKERLHMKRMREKLLEN